jgi:hypothetical protein
MATGFHLDPPEDKKWDQENLAKKYCRNRKKIYCSYQKKKKLINRVISMYHSTIIDSHSRLFQT